MNIILLGMNHKTAPVEMRERLSIACDDEGKMIEAVKNISQVKEVLYLATCNRVEVLAHVNNIDATVEGLKAVILSRRESSRQRDGGVSLCIP